MNDDEMPHGTTVNEMDILVLYNRRIPCWRYGFMRMVVEGKKDWQKSCVYHRHLLFDHAPCHSMQTTKLCVVPSRPMTMVVATK